MSRYWLYNNLGNLKKKNNKERKSGKWLVVFVRLLHRHLEIVEKRAQQVLILRQCHASLAGETSGTRANDDNGRSAFFPCRWWEMFGMINEASNAGFFWVFFKIVFYLFRFRMVYFELKIFKKFSHTLTSTQKENDQILSLYGSWNLMNIFRALISKPEKESRKDEC